MEARYIFMPVGHIQANQYYIFRGTNAMNQADYDFFHTNGYLGLGKVLNEAEIARFVHGFDRNHNECAYLWRYLGTDTHQTGNCDALPSWLALDDIVRHHRILPVVQDLMKDPLSILEVSARHMDVHPGAVKIAQQWHRDTPHLAEHPLRMDYIQAMVYLTDVHEDTHCFTISPESADGPILERDEQLEKGGMQYLHGSAGTVTLFNASVLHTATVRTTQYERKTIQIYYCHRDRKLGKLDMVIPADLWRDHAEAEAKDLYGPQMQAATPSNYRELQAGQMQIHVQPDPTDTLSQDTCPWNAAEETDTHRCMDKGGIICPHFHGTKRPDIVLCGYPK
jgi:ectoine hydroxylase-related dioxygenase (phytanoyl-CoA dioxygenase family)